MIDTTEALHAFLSADAGLVAQVGSRIYGPPGLPTGYRGEKAIVIIPDGGPARATVPLVEDRVQIRCYGPTPAAAHEVYEALYDALHRKGAESVTVTAGTVALGRALQMGGPMYMVEPELGWHFWATTWALIWTDRVLA